MLNAELSCMCERERMVGRMHADLAAYDCVQCVCLYGDQLDSIQCVRQRGRF